MKNSAVLLVQCPDRKGLDAAIAEFLYRHDGNILNFEQHSAGQERFYHARVEWDLSGFKLALDQFATEFRPVAHRFGMNWSVAPSSHRPRVAIFVSKLPHCLYDLLARWRMGEFAAHIAFVLSNHDDTPVHLALGVIYYRIGFHDVRLSCCLRRFCCLNRRGSLLNEGALTGSVSKTDADLSN